MNKRMHVAHYTNTYFPVTSGVVRSVSTFRQALTELGHNVFIFAQKSQGYHDTEPFVFRYPAVDLPLMSGFPLTIPISPFIDKVIPYLKLNVIHSHHPFLLGQTAATKAEELNLPLVFTYHTRYRDYSHYIFLQQDFVKETIGRWVGEYMQKCHHIVVPSESIQQMLMDDYGIIDRVSVVPTGIDLAAYAHADGQPLRRAKGWRDDDIILISVGRLAKEKNWETLLEGVAIAVQGRDKVRLILVGDGDDRDDLEDYAAELGIAGQVEFTGSIPFEDIPTYLSAANIFCFASTTETQGLVTMEAMAARLPIVAIDGSGTRDVAEDKKEGFLTENNPEAFAEALKQMIDSAALRTRFKSAAWEKAQTFEMKLQAKKLVAVYEQAIEDHKANQRVLADQEKEIFTLLSDEQWTRLLGLENRNLNREH